jgi:hypothetical protein
MPVGPALNAQTPPPAKPPGWSPDIVVIAMGQPVPRGPGIEWWLQCMLKRASSP